MLVPFPGGKKQRIKENIATYLDVPREAKQASKAFVFFLVLKIKAPTNTVWGSQNCETSRKCVCVCAFDSC